MALGLSFGLSAWFGLGALFAAPGGAVDFQAAYYPVRCLMEHHDPYNVEALHATYVEAERQPPPEGVFRADVVIGGFVYQPTVFPLIAPFVWMGWSTAWRVWMLLLVGGLFTSGVMMWRVAERAAPRAAIVLVCLLLANGALSIASANPAGVAIALCAVAVWCFLEKRQAAVGVACLAVSLLLKPHDTGLVWLFLLLAGGVWRRRAWQTLVVTAVAGAAALAWVTAVAPQWRTEWSANLAAISEAGKMNNPAALTAEELRITHTIVDLQAVSAVFWRNPKVYGAISATMCGGLLLAVAAFTVRRRLTASGVWLGLTAVAPLALLAMYHRPYDCRLLLLAIPGCAELVRRGGWTGKVSVALTGAAIVLTGDLTTSVLVGVPESLHLGATTLGEKVAILLLTRAGVLALLAMSVFHLAVYLRSLRGNVDDTLVAYDSRWAGAEASL